MGLINQESKEYSNIEQQSLACFRVVPFGLIFLGPPCSLFVAASSSVHRRQPWRLEGDTSRFCVRLANQVWRNMVALMKH